MDPVVVAVIVVIAAIVAWRAVLVVRPDTTAVIERLGRFRACYEPGRHLIVPFLDRVRARVDRREQVIRHPGVRIPTQDHYTVGVPYVLHFHVADARAAVYEISDYHAGLEQLVLTTLRNVVGGSTLEQARGSYHQVRQQLQHVLQEAGRWGITVNRVELTSIESVASNV